MLIVSRGVSVEDYDVMVDFFTTMSGNDTRLLFNRIAKRPDSPTSAVVINIKARIRTFRKSGQVEVIPLPYEITMY